MAAPTPFDLGLPMDAEPEIDPAFRTPPRVAPGADLEREKLQMDDRAIINLLGSFFDEAENARETGLNPRHEVWEQNLHAFWMRKDFGDKLDWQSKEVTAQVPNFVERFSAIHRAALAQMPDWAEVEMLKDPHGALSKFATKLTRAALDFCGTNGSGQPISFEAIFGNVVLTGSLMEMMLSVTWDEVNKRVISEQVDPRQCYFDPTGRGLYRVRFYEVDKETLLRMAERKDASGAPLFDKEAIEGLIAHHDNDIVTNKEDSSGAGQDLHSPRTPILIKEWLVDLISREGGDIGSHKVRERQLVVTANDDTIIRGPEPNPWWHGKDWIVAHPVLQAPLRAVDGRTYVELFRHSVETHENVTNRILDLMAMNMNAFEVSPELLDNPENIEFGIAPNQTFLRADDAPPNEQAIRPIQMGNQVTPDMINVWQATKRDAQEAAAQSDLSLGQTVSIGDATATEVNKADAGQSSLNNSISMDIDGGFLTPFAELVYYCALQHASPQSPLIWNALTDEEKAMFTSQRQEFKTAGVVVKAQGLTQSVERQKRLRGLLGALNVIGGNPILIQEYQKSYSTERLVSLVLEDFGVPLDRLKLNDQEKLRKIDEMAKEKFAAQMAGQPGPVGAPANTAQNQNGLDPLAQGVPEGLPGGVGQ